METEPSTSPQAPGTMPVHRSSLIQSSLARELLKGEILRVTAQIAVLAALMGIVVLLRLFPGVISQDIRASVLSTSSKLLAVLALYLAYEAVVRQWLAGILRRERFPSPWWRFANAAIEISLPTVTMVLLVGGVGSIPALAGAVPFVYFLLIASFVLSLDFRLCAFAGALSAVQFLALNLQFGNAVPSEAPVPALSILTSPHQYGAKCAILLLAGFAAGFVARQFRAQLVRVIDTLDQRDRAISMFGQHVSPQVADMLLKQDIDFSGEQRDVCVMFLDIRDFSVFANSHTAPEVVSYLNSLFEFMIPLVNSNHGVVNKFLGDGFMAVFGAPLPGTDMCGNAVRASLAILGRLDELNRTGAGPATRIGIGLHSGQVSTGNVGTAERKEYTVIGDVVNLASRIEQATKALHAELLVSEPVAHNISGRPGLAVEDMGLVELKGQAQPQRLFKLR